MLRTKVLILTVVTAIGQFAVLPSDAEAGCLLDWLRGRRSRTAVTATPTTAYAATNAYGLQPGQCATTCQQTCSRVVVNYVPCTAYRTCWNRVPVTQYRPVTNTDPCTGCTVTCMRPCTTYTWQMQRVPYTTYRPVYRTQTYRVPITTITNDCNTCAPNTCAPCNTVGQSSTSCPTCTSVPVTTTSPINSPTSAGSVILDQGTQTVLPGSTSSYQSVPGGTIGTDGYYNTVPSTPNGSPADTTPFLNVNPQNMQRPIIDRLQNVPDNTAIGSPRLKGPQNNRFWRAGDQQNQNSYNGNTIDDWSNSAPVLINVDDKTARSPVRRQWDYSPVRLASYNSPVDDSAENATGPVAIRGEFRPQKTGDQRINAQWKTEDW